MSGLHNGDVTAAAEKLDAKLAELATQVTGATATIWRIIAPTQAAFA